MRQDRQSANHHGQDTGQASADNHHTTRRCILQVWNIDPTLLMSVDERSSLDALQLLVGLTNEFAPSTLKLSALRVLLKVFSEVAEIASNSKLLLSALLSERYVIPIDGIQFYGLQRFIECFVN